MIEENEPVARFKSEERRIETRSIDAYIFANLLLLNFKLIFLKFSLDFRSVTASFCFGDLKSLEQPRRSFESITNARCIAISF